MKRALLITGSVVLAFAAVIVWILIFSGLGVLLEKGWDGGDITMFVIVFPIAVALSVGAILLMLAGVRYKQSSAAARIGQRRSSRRRDYLRSGLLRHREGRIRRARVGLCPKTGTTPSYLVSNPPHHRRRLLVDGTSGQRC